MRKINRADDALPLPSVGDTFALRSKIYQVNRIVKDDYYVKHINQGKQLERLQPAKEFIMQLPIKRMSMMEYKLNPKKKKRKKKPLSKKKIDFLNSL